MPTLSIITVTYNRAGSLKQNTASVLAQAFTDIEHIIVDNLSNDGTEQVVREYQRAAPYPVVYIREPDTGIYNAINKGLRRANGVWTHILHSDDQYTSASVLSDVFTRDLSGYDLIANAILVADAAHPAQKRLWVPSYKSDIRHFDFPHTGVILRKEFYEEYGYYKERFRIISDAVHGIQHYGNAAYLIVPAPLVLMSSAGVSNEASLRNLCESIVCMIVYHRFPWYLKGLSISRYIFRYLSRPERFKRSAAPKFIHALRRASRVLESKPRQRTVTIRDQVFVAQEYAGYSVLYLPGNALITRLKYASDIYEPQVTELLRQEMHRREAKVFLDVGANLGLISLALLSRFPDLRIEAFEPDPQQSRALEATIEYNRLQTRLHLHQVALADHEGDTDFYTHAAGNDSGNGNVDTGRTGAAAKITVPVQTLDAWWRANGEPDIPVAKIDTEGAELLILKGAQDFLKACQPTLLLEIWPDNLKGYPYGTADILRWLEEHNYVLLTLQGTVVRPDVSEEFWRREASYVAMPVGQA